MQPTVTSLWIGRHKVRYAILDQFWLPPSVTLFHASRDLLKYVTHLGPPIVSSTCIHTCLCVSSRGFCSEVCLGFSGRFSPGWFLSVHLLSEYIHYNIKLNITFNFRFVWNLKKVLHHMLLDLLPCLKLSHLLGPPPPLAWRTWWTAPWRTMTETSLLYKEERRVSVECRLVKPDWCGMRSEIVFGLSLIWDNTMRSLSL